MSDLFRANKAVLRCINNSLLSPFFWTFCTYGDVDASPSKGDGLFMSGRVQTHAADRVSGPLSYWININVSGA